MHAHAVEKRDWLVTGVTPEQLRQLGYRQVGRDFPIFLHPNTKEEYALPRADRGNPEAGGVSLEDDLARRDLTINAMALDENGRLIDPCNGEQDLADRILRHTSAFSEDPIRVLRLARFAARYHSLGFSIADETYALVRNMARNGQLDNLVPERCFAELAKALTEQHPDIFLHDLGKGTTPQGEWPRHIGHEQRGAALVGDVSRRMRAPDEWERLARYVARYHLDCHRAMELRPSTILKLLQKLDALRRPERFERLLLACHADLLG
ncbi:MAG: multifunctional CCA tRNA nucleotidyl transferase/2'3'-cyclic phosphodiesterase/2'nucleotidase/phosphatase, partial [Gammaproteobacteria bacterium]